MPSRTASPVDMPRVLRPKPAVRRRTSSETSHKDAPHPWIDELEQPPETFFQLLTMLYRDNTGESVVRYKAEDEEPEHEEVMSNKKFVHLCNSNNTTWFELYFDLMFVAYILVLGNLLKSISHDETTASRWRHFWETNMLFFLGWLTWTHLNMYMASFQPLGMVRFIQFTLSAMMMALASVVVKKSDEEGFTSGIRFTSPVILYLLTRICFTFLYGVTLWFYRTPFMLPQDDEEEEEGEEEWVDLSGTLKIYVLGFTMSSLVSVVALAIGDGQGEVRIILISVSLLIELIMYPVALYDSIRWDKEAHKDEEKHPDKIVPSKVQRFEHKELIERNELWIVIVTGEAVLSIVTTSSSSSYTGTNGVDYFLTLFLCILIVIQLLRIYFTSQPEWEVKFDQHATMTTPLNALLYIFCHFLISLGIFLLGVAMVFFIKFENKPDDMKQVYALLLSGGLSLALFGINSARETHKWQQNGDKKIGQPKIPVLWMTHGRKYLLIIHNVLSLSLFAFGYTIDNEKVSVTSGGTTTYKYESTGVLTPQLMLLVLLLILIILGYIEMLLEPPFYILQRFKLQLDENVEMHKSEEQHQRQLARTFKARTAWRKVKNFVMMAWKQPPSPEEQTLWKIEETSYYEKIDTQYTWLREQAAWRRKLCRLSSGHRYRGGTVTEDDKVLARLYDSFWERKETSFGIKSFLSLVAHAQDKHHVFHHKRTNRALGEKRESGFTFDYRRTSIFEFDDESPLSDDSHGHGDHHHLHHHHHSLLLLPY
eukprot:m.114267 g.114267  ORF g.114267 m.114267 type:complete len:765 (-) comp10832_c3_seq1:11-2305(-)